MKSKLKKNKDKTNLSFTGLPKALVINGANLAFDSAKGLFLEVAKYCNSVICCRAAPLQKVSREKCSDFTTVLFGQVS